MSFNLRDKELFPHGKTKYDLTNGHNEGSLYASSLEWGGRNPRRATDSRNQWINTLTLQLKGQNYREGKGLIR